MRRLSCGHEPSPHSDTTTGTCKLPIGIEVCWSCGDDWTRRRIAARLPCSAYLSNDGKTLTTWSGGKLADVTSYRTSKHGFHGSTIVTWRAVDGWGRHWYGRGAGNCMLTTMRPSKSR